MTEDKKTTVFEIVKIGGASDNIIYWSAVAKDDPWVNAEKDTWEMKVDFND